MHTSSRRGGAAPPDRSASAGFRERAQLLLDHLVGRADDLAVGPVGIADEARASRGILSEGLRPRAVLRRRVLAGLGGSLYGFGGLGSRAGGEQGDREDQGREALALVEHGGSSFAMSIYPKR